MLIEVRKLIFPEADLIRALITHIKAEGIDVPNTQVQGVVVEDGDPIKATLQFVTADPKKPYEVKLNEMFLLTAMILACKDYGVPLARSARKSLQRHDVGPQKGLAMVMSMQVEPPAA